MLYIELFYLYISAVPIFLPNVTTIKNINNSYLTVGFISSTPFRSVQWRKGGDLVFDDNNAILNNCHIRNNLTEVQSTLHLTPPFDEKYGSYKVSVKNDVGFAERIVEFEKPSHGK